MGVETDGDGAAADSWSRAGVEDVEIEGAIVVVVSEVCKVRVELCCDVLLGVLDGDGEVAIAVLVLVVGVEGD